MNFLLGLWTVFVFALWVATPKLLGWDDGFGICCWYLFTWWAPIIAIFVVEPGFLK